MKRNLSILPVVALAVLSITGCSGFQTALFPVPTPVVTHPNDIKTQFGWIAGSSTGDQPGVYGTQGLSGPSDSPGGRTWAAAAADSSGNLWLFGGEGLDSAATVGPDGYSGELNDLWKFSPATGQWTWINGSNVAGQATAASGPGARHGAAAWCDSSGNFWLYGGVNVSDPLEDFWEYTPASGKWNPISMANAPGTRFWAVSWVDSANNLWLFGGEGGGNDLWEYSISTSQWTMVSGSTNILAPGVYGTIGVPSATNTPGARRESTGWTDSAGNLWLFGGDGADVNGNFQVLNDLWKFDTTRRMWAWMSGSSVSNPIGAYGTMDTASSVNTPGGRFAAFSWADKHDIFWVFGGQGNDSTTNSNVNALNDLWSYSPRTNLWTWVAGSNVGDQQGLYGPLGNMAFSNVIGARKSGVSWVDSSSNLWLFGGQGSDSHNSYDRLNEVWKIQTYLPL